MLKKPFVSKDKILEISEKYPTPFYIYDEKGIRENAEKVKKAFSWNKGFREYFAVKANPNPFILSILKEYDCGTDCSSLTELQLMFIKYMMKYLFQKEWEIYPYIQKWEDLC